MSARTEHHMTAPAEADPVVVLTEFTARAAVRVDGAMGVRRVLARAGVHLAEDEVESIEPGSAVRFAAAHAVIASAAEHGEKLGLLEALRRMEA